MVRRSEPSEVLRAEGPRHTAVQQSLNYLGLQHTAFQAITYPQSRDFSFSSYFSRPGTNEKMLSGIYIYI